VRATLASLGSPQSPSAVTKSAWAYVEVRRMILDGELEPGATVNQEELARHLAISITPLREALGRLETEGFIVLNAHRTMMVNGLSAQELDDLYCLRILLDPLAASLAAASIEGAETKRLEDLVRINFEQPPAEVMASNHEFHRAVYAASGNVWLTRILDQLWAATERYRISLIARRGPEIADAAREHTDIALAVIGHDAARAEQLMRHHVQGTLKTLKLLLEGRTD
jgi:DNA-binding GntR family transcriptional regulator